MRTAPTLCAVALILGLPFGVSATAEVIELDGTIKSIDPDARSVTIVRKTPTGEKVLELEVAKNAGDLTGFEKGDEVSVAYDSTLEIISSMAKRVSGDLLLVAGSEWATEAGGMRLRILTREGNQYTGLVFVGEGTLREVKGTITGDKLQWLAKDVTALKGKAGGDNFGVLSQDGKGPKLDFKYNYSDGKGGTFTLRKTTSPGGTAAEGPKKGSPDDDSLARDMNLLQGEWKNTLTEESGNRLEPAEQRRENRTVFVKGNTLRMERVKSGTFGFHEGTFRLDAGKHLFDMQEPGGLTYIGIYEVNDDTLKLCYRLYPKGSPPPPRPTEFTTSAEKPPVHNYEYKRVKE